MRIAALVKQVPAFDAMELGADGRLVRDGLTLEMNPYCRRAVAKGVELARSSGGSCTVITLGPPSAEDCLREAIAWGCDDGVLVSDPVFAGSDTIATAQALAAALERVGPFDLVLVGRNSVDADTGQVGPQLAELCDVAFATGVKELAVDGGSARVRCEEDDGYSDRVVALPAILSCAERLCDPAKVDPEGRAAVSASRIATLHAGDLGPGPWGQEASGTYVGEVRVLEVSRERRMLDGSLSQQVADAVKLLAERGALDDNDDSDATGQRIGAALAITGPAVVVAVEPGRGNVTRELLGAANRIAAEMGGHVVAVAGFAFPNGVGERDSLDDTELEQLASWGADTVVAVARTGAPRSLAGSVITEEDSAAALAQWALRAQPWAVLLPSTTWGREVGGRTAAALGAGLTGDAVELEVTTVRSTGERQLLAWKPAFGGQLVAAIYCSTPIQMATVRAGVLSAPVERAGFDLAVERVAVESRGRVVITSSVRDDDLDALATAHVVVGVGAGVDPGDYGRIDALAALLGAEVAATRKVTDRAWLPRARQIGITGRSVAPRLYIGIGLSGKFNHAVGVRAAGTVLGINNDPAALLWDHADIGIIGDWREVVPLLTAALERRA
ncbi:MAG: FAD-binding protein [Acidimicrobiales bacterium]